MGAGVGGGVSLISMVLAYLPDVIASMSEGPKDRREYLKEGEHLGRFGPIHHRRPGTFQGGLANTSELAFTDTPRQEITSQKNLKSETYSNSGAR